MRSRGFPDGGLNGLCSSASRRADHHLHYEGAIAITLQHTELGLADAQRVRQHRVEHRLELAGRAGDHAQYLGGRRPLLQRFAQIIGALARLFQQSSVFDRDDGLGSEHLQQILMLLGSGARLGPSGHNRT
jgi:hypothetical protein